MRLNSLHQLILASVICIFFSCQGDSANTSSLFFSNSTGGFDEILAVADKSSLDNYLREPTKNTFGVSYDVLPQYEPIFTTRIIGFNDFDRIFKRFRTIVFFCDLSDNTTITEFVKTTIGESNVAKAMKEDNFYYAMKKNVWAEPQLIIFVFEPDKQKLISRVESGLHSILQIIAQNELMKYKNNAYLKGLNYELTRSIAAKHGLSLDIPKEYELAIESDDFLWIRKVTHEKSHNIMISFKSWNQEEQIDAIAWRNVLGKAYITSNIEGAYMISDTILPFLEREYSVQNLKMYESRGLWKMVNDFMGGPFLNYIIPDERNSRLIMLDGFAYAPGEEKRPMIRSLEAIFTTFGLVDDQQQ